MSSSIGSCLHFVVRFVLDEYISTIPGKRIVNPAPSSITVGESYTVKWTDGPYEAVVLATGMLALLVAYILSSTHVSSINFS